jgi:hypothetical protein
VFVLQTFTLLLPASHSLTRWSTAFGSTETNTWAPKRLRNVEPVSPGREPSLCQKILDMENLGLETGRTKWAIGVRRANFLVAETDAHARKRRKSRVFS